jgi:hypothetical protein
MQLIKTISMSVSTFFGFAETSRNRPKELSQDYSYTFIEKDGKLKISTRFILQGVYGDPTWMGSKIRATMGVGILGITSRYEANIYKGRMFTNEEVKQNIAQTIADYIEEYE